jgi:tRNA modification GTPase
MAPAIAQTLLGWLPAPREATFSRWRDSSGEIIDTGIAIFFSAPGSFTGEDVLELQGHAGLIVEALIDRVVELGARRARPGEFSERAFLNDKIDLAQAEAIADLIDAGSRGAARAAMRSLQGEFSARVAATRAALTQLRVYVEAAIDFPEEEIDFLASTELAERVEYVRRLLDEVMQAARRGARLARGMTVVIAGRPNAGKSTLLNQLAGYDAAIVTPVPGTTRDPLRVTLDINGVPVELIDTAGLRDLPASVASATDDIDSANAIEAEGMRRAREAIARADCVLYLVDAAADPEARSFEAERSSLPEGVQVMLVMNKSDLVEGASHPVNMAATSPLHACEVAPPRISLSAATGAGVEALRRHLASAGGHTEAGGCTFSARSRHVEALERAARQMDAAIQQLASKRGELAAFELRGAQAALGEVIGDVSSDELLGHIFSSFCIGK